MKFYSDSAYNNELIITSDNKIQLEDEILLADVKTPITQTIYWKWEYRTDVLPSADVLTKYNTEVGALVTEYNIAGKTDAEKQEIVLKINDKIDSKEAGGEVVLPVKVIGIQKHPDGFKLNSIHITSEINKVYKKGDEVTFNLEFTEGVYNINKTEITSDTAPEVYVGFDENVVTGDNLITKVANIKKEKIYLAEVDKSKKATFVGVDKNKIKYSYKIQDNDKGKFNIVEISGTVYNKKEKQINLEKKEIDDNIEVEESIIEETSDGIKMIVDTPDGSIDYIMNKVYGEDDWTFNKQDDYIYIHFGTAYRSNPIMCNVNEIDWSKYTCIEAEIEITGNSSYTWRNIEWWVINSDFSYMDYPYFINNSNIIEGENQYLNKRVTVTLDLTKYVGKNIRYIGFGGNNYDMKLYKMRLY